MKLTSLIKESIDDKAADLWNKYKGRIYNDPQVMNPKNIAVAVLTDPLWAIKWIEDWASKNDDEYEHPDDFPPKDKALEAIKEYVRENLRITTKQMDALNKVYKRVSEDLFKKD